MIELDKVSVVFHPNTPDERRALKDVSLRMEKGEFLTVIGSNGAGKSTMLNVVAAAVPVAEGKVRIDGIERTGEPEYKRARSVGRVFQDPLGGTAAEMSVEDNLIVASRKGWKRIVPAKTPARKKEFRELLAQLDMGLEDRMGENVARLSGGQRQALTLLMAVVSRPAALLLDEHTAALDPANAEKVLALTERFAAEYGLTVLMVTHDMGRAIEIGSRLVMMDGGEIIMDIAGAAKKELTVDGLVSRFRELRKKGLDSDRALLS